jgi:diguanylate cyclase
MHNAPAALATDARTDAETGLPSRAAFQEDIRRRLAEAQRHGNRLSIMLIKVGSLAELFDRRGDSAGNLVLRACTQFFTAAVRDMDLLARYDRDVFGIELPGTALADAVTVGKRIKGHIESCPLQLMDEKLSFRICVGVAEAQPGDDLASLIERTEKALQAGLAAVGNHVHFHNGISVESTAPQSMTRAAVMTR